MQLLISIPRHRAALALTLLSMLAAMVWTGLAVAGSGGWRVLATVPQLPSGAPMCVGTSDCWVPLGRSILATSDGGRNWQKQRIPPGRTATSVWCVTSLACFATVANLTGRALGYPIIQTTDGGRTWSGDQVSGGVTDWNSISCASTTFCAALGDAPWSGAGCVPAPGPCVPIDAPAVAATSDGGRSWTVTKNIAYRQGFSSSYTVMYSMSCPAVGVCFAGGFHSAYSGGRFLANVGTMMVTIDGGKTWRFQRVPSGINLFWDIACVNARDCWAAGRTGERPTDHGVLIAATDGGAHWHTQNPPPGTASMNWISCADTRHCVSLAVLRPAFAPAFARTNDGGRHWFEQPPPAGATGIARFDCSTATFCLAAVRESSGTWTLQAN